ncbi:hypothetical protein [Streptomyces rubiginosohelvolus]
MAVAESAAGFREKLTPRRALVAAERSFFALLYLLRGRLGA